MANILVAQVNVYGKEQNIDAFVEQLEKHVDYLEPKGKVENSQGHTIQKSFVGYFRWNISDTLTKQAVLQLCNKFDVSIDANGYEAGLLFFEAAAIDRYGQVVQEEAWDMEMKSTYFDPYKEPRLVSNKK
jgi:hypothetical protein